MMLAREIFGDSFRTLRADKLSAAILELCRDGEREADREGVSSAEVEKRVQIND